MIIIKIFFFLSLKMAKKIKQKKTGMLRRKQQKRQKKKVQRRSTMSSRRPQNLNNQENIEQLLSILPTLAFEQELIDLRMDESKHKKFLENKLPETNIFFELLTDDFLHDLDKRLSKIEELNPEKSVKTVLAKATRHQLANNQKFTYLSNPLLIAIFLKTQSSVEGFNLDLEGLSTALEEFNSRNGEIIHEIAENYQGIKSDGAEKIDSEEFDTNETIQNEAPSLDPNIYKKFLELTSKDKQNQIEEDLEVFLVDFKPPPVADWNLDLIKYFVSKWFLENANPMEEDIKSMRNSLLDLFQFLTEEKLLSEHFLQEVSQYLKIS